jgi:phage terminase small subunit
MGKASKGQRDQSTSEKHHGHVLTDRENQVVEEYLISFNKTKAYKAGGYKNNPATVSQCANSFFKKSYIRAAVNKKIEEKRDRTEITLDRIDKEIAKIAFANMGDYWANWNAMGGELKEKSQLTTDQLAAIESIEFKPTDQGITIKIKLHSKLDALKELRERYTPKQGTQDDPYEFARTMKAALAEIESLGMEEPPGDQDGSESIEDDEK